jgi:hypothetical protein
MTTQDIVQDYRLGEWALMITEQRDSGQSVRKWCKGHGISVKTYYYRRNRVREELAEGVTEPINKTVFAALPMPKSGCAAIIVHIRDITAEIRSGADAEMIENVIKALARL